jgi:hypothetical protein
MNAQYIISITKHMKFYIIIFNYFFLYFLEIGSHFVFRTRGVSYNQPLSSSMNR